MLRAVKVFNSPSCSVNFIPIQFNNFHGEGCGILYAPVLMRFYHAVEISGAFHGSFTIKEESE